MTKAKGLFLAIAFGFVSMVGGDVTAKEFEGIAQDLPLNVPYGPFPPGPAGVAQAGGIGAGQYGGVMPAGHAPYAPGGVQMASCDIPCDDSCTGCSSCGPERIGLLNKLFAGGNTCSTCGVGMCGGCGHFGLGRLCLFCRGAGCGVCQTCFDPRQLCGALALLAPYQEGGLCAQRWYDFSAEALYLDYDATVSRNAVLARAGIGGPAVLSVGDADTGGSEAGMRLSGAILFGAGGNLEMTYMGLNQWNGEAVVEDPTGNLFSVISNFGTAPPGGFPQTDATERQAVSLESEFHSGEWNYRRRWVGPYCRFQGSWLAGIRYLNISEDFAYRTDETLAGGPQFFRSLTDTRNSMTGFQLGGDLWWNVTPGINIGIGMKGAVLGNDAKQTTQFNTETLVAPIVVTAEDSSAAYLSEFQATIVYRFTYSWSARFSYHALTIDDIALGASNLALPNPNGANLQTTLAQTPALLNNDDSLDLSGFSTGFEYIW